jgi:SprT protein
MQAQFEAIRNKVNECIRRAEDKFGIKMPPVDVRFDLTGRAAGMACMRAGHFYLRFNIHHIRLGGQTWEHLLNDTVPHELAHTVCQAFPQFGRNHDAGWKRVCLALGGNGRRCYSEDDAPEAIAAARPYVYITTDGAEVRVTKVLHSKIQKGAAYSVRGKGKLNKECQYSYMTAPAVQAAKKPVVFSTETVPAKEVARVPAASKGSKADHIRAWIALGLDDDAIVARAVAELAMTRQLAKTYVKNNRSRV